MKTNHYNRNGFTLTEAMMAMVILAVVSAGVILPFAGGAAVQNEGARRTIGAKLAGDLLEEIMNTDFEQVGAYDGYSEAAGQIKGVNGQVLTGPVYTELSRTVTCSDAYIEDVRLIWVTVIVSYRGDELVRLSTLIGE